MTAMLHDMLWAWPPKAACGAIGTEMIRIRSDCKFFHLHRNGPIGTMFIRGARNELCTVVGYSLCDTAAPSLINE